MALANPYAAYKQTQTTTSSQVQLIIMLHDGAIRSLAKAAEALGKRDYNTKAEMFGKALKIIEHLWGTLDKEKGGEIAANLDQVYSYMHARVMEGNIHDDFGPIKEVIGHLRGLRESWAAVDNELKNQRGTVLKQPVEQNQGHEDFEMAA